MLQLYSITNLKEPLEPLIYPRVRSVQFWRTTSQLLSYPIWPFGYVSMWCCFQSANAKSIFQQPTPNNSYQTFSLYICRYVMVSSSSVYGSVKILHSIHIVKGPCIMCQSTKTSSKAYLITCPHHLDLCVIYKEIKLYFHFMKQESFSLPACTSAEWMQRRK